MPDMLFCMYILFIIMYICFFLYINVTLLYYILGSFQKINVNVNAMLMFVNIVSVSSWKFPHIFFLCSLRKPIGSHWLENVLLELFSLSFFIKWWNSIKPFFFSMSKQYFCQTFFSQKCNRNIFVLLKCTSMDFVRLFGFWQKSH